MVAALKPALYPCMVARALLLGAWDLGGQAWAFPVDRAWTFSTIGRQNRVAMDKIDDWECKSRPWMDVFDDWEIKMDVSDDWETENDSQSCKTSMSPHDCLPIV